ncbi:threonine--tRNA ligase [Candidatus Finniella inopinata]|uniref:Threonine--tRNA ligase n=1 Tax=Candidatus Finniella inopinata TaxID=1696036 RepID=A0A4Q7DIS1_9PROT|nr:threonine--tRNA ligase [Candidatus Finniella inopinata]RZI46198.1 threonine--tRNA ligase [Candidatus Finniella inopinata]
MFQVVLKDGSKRDFDKAVTGEEVARSLSPRLAKEAVAVRVNGQLWDMNRLMPDQAQIDIITRNDPDGLEVIRHDTAHVTAEAVKDLYPETQITIGPSIENGFYYDFHRETKFTPDDLILIEARMHEIIKRDEKISREEWQRDDAVEFFKSQGEHFKAELIASIPSNEPLTLYRQGGFIDLCRGPHLPSTGRIGKAFKLMKLAGAYWRGDHRNPMLQRIYGTAWATEQQLQDYLTQLEEAEKRDHRRLGAELGLFHFQEEAAGSVFWHPKGWQLYRNLENFVRSRLEKTGYVEVKTPQLVDRSLWEASGHWEKFGEHMFTVASEEKTLAIKPMNCPCHVQIFKQGLKSYRDLPLRMAEFGSCHRNEPSGALHGLMRVRAFVQDDAHIFCTPEQIVSETKDFCDLLKDMYRDLGFTDVRVKFSDRPATRAGGDEVWDLAEKSLMEAATAAGLDFTLNPGEGAFYGPKLEFVLKDTIGREWQCGTLQVDFVLPERLDAVYVGEDGKRHRPVMLHRAILGSFERFIGVLIEQYAGKFPLWLAPVQAVVATITSEGEGYAKELYDRLKQLGIRVEIDTRNEKISYKVREHSLQKIPYLLVVGKREAEQKTVAVRILGGEQQEMMGQEEIIARLLNESRNLG